jgi:hypothetical protein
MIAKPISIKDAKRKFGGCAQKAVELISDWITSSAPHDRVDLAVLI